MNKEIYIWIVAIAVIISAALYIRYFYQPQISIALNISSGTQTTFYPYQVISFSIGAFNNGGIAIQNMSLGIDINNNLTRLYKVTLPVGKQTMFVYNYTPKKEGTYVVSVVADPAKLYNLADRSTTSAITSITINRQDNAIPWSLLPGQNVSFEEGKNLSRAGFIVSSYIADKYNMSKFALTDNVKINRFLNPILNVTYLSLVNISVANAKYTNNNSAYSIWLRGTLPDGVFRVAANGADLQATSSFTKAGNITLIKITNSSTLCEWYSGGWSKILAYVGEQSCTDILNNTHLNGTSIVLIYLNGSFQNRINIKNATILGSYRSTATTGYEITYTREHLSTISLFGNSSFIYAGIGNDAPLTENSICFGIISRRNDSSYCSTYILPASGKITGLSLIRTTGYTGPYNITVMSLVNTSTALSQVGTNVGILRDFNLSGNYLAFKSGLVNTCSFNSSFGCGNVTYLNGTISFRLKNNLNNAIRLNSIKCYTSVPTFGITPNTTISGGAEMNISTGCYNIATKLSGGVLDLNLHLSLNYTLSNSTRTLTGNAFIVFG